MNQAVIEKNKSPRKRGGKKKGANSFVKVRFIDLKGYISEQIPMTISRVWLESLGFKIEAPDLNSLRSCPDIAIQSHEEVPAMSEDKVDFKIFNGEE
tara:strand:+ start:106 stop:396 length:291 start_codon:yes stop_codon:yes gene_type:complete